MSTALKVGTPRRIRSVIVLVWSAVAVSLSITVVSIWLSADMNAMVDRAVTAGRLPIYSGQADNIAIPVVLMAMAMLPATLVTAALAWIIQRGSARGRVAWRLATSLAVTLVLFVGLASAYIVDWTGGNENSLYSYWYRPFLVAGGVCYALALIGCVVLLPTPGARKPG